jgi:hypothetical protein
VKLASWRPAVVVAAAGGLLALLSVLLALWSKALVKDAQRVECSDRAADIVLGVRDALLERAKKAEASVDGRGRADDVCASVAAVWLLAGDGAVVQAWGVEGKADRTPPEALAAAVAPSRCRSRSRAPARRSPRPGCRAARRAGPWSCGTPTRSSAA